MELPKIGNKASYIVESGEYVTGKVIGIDIYEQCVIVTLRLGDGSLYRAKLRKRFTTT